MRKQGFELIRLSLVLTVLLAFVLITPLDIFSQSVKLPLLEQYQMIELDNDDVEYLEQYQKLQSQLNKFHLIGLYKVTEPGDTETFSLNIPATYQQRKSLRVWYFLSSYSAVLVLSSFKPCRARKRSAPQAAPCNRQSAPPGHSSAGSGQSLQRHR